MISKSYKLVSIFPKITFIIKRANPKTSYQLNVYHLDVNNAFLYCNLDEKVFISLPQFLKGIILLVIIMYISCLSFYMGLNKLQENAIKIMLTCLKLALFKVLTPILYLLEQGGI